MVSLCKRLIDALSLIYSTILARFFASYISLTDKSPLNSISSKICSVSFKLSVEFSMALELYTVSAISTSSIILPNSP